jgi:DNA repair exonuclease SbcCD nuclease subunit
MIGIHSMKAKGGDQSLDKYAYVGAVLSDIHSGAFEAKQWYMELEKGFVADIEKLAILDFLVITGDFFDMKISANSEHAKYALKLLSKLLKICTEKNAKFRIIKGTESHDNKQLEMFEGLEVVTNCDFRVIHTVESEMLFDDMKVLYIPEEYMENKDEFYKPYFEDGPYDYIFGHGLVDKAVFIAATQESEVTRSQAPIFKTDDLHAICRGPIYFGHIHKPMKIDRFRYIGSYSRWAFGEEEDKGYVMTYYTPETGDYTDEFIPNNRARRFDTVKIEYTSTVFNKTEEEQIKHLLDLASSIIVDYLRLEINIPEEYPNASLLTNMIHEAFAKYSKVKLKINNNSKLRQKKEMEEKVNLLLDRYGFIFDKGLEPEEKISRYIKIKNGRNISVDRMRRYLYEEILTRKGEKS